MKTTRPGSQRARLTPEEVDTISEEMATADEFFVVSLSDIRHLIDDWRAMDIVIGQSISSLTTIAVHLDGMDKSMAESVRRVRGELSNAARPVQPEEPCVWTWDDIQGKYDTACGRSWEFTDGDVAENAAHYCIGCGGLIQERRTEADDE